MKNLTITILFLGFIVTCNAQNYLNKLDYTDFYKKKSKFMKNGWEFPIQDKFSDALADRVLIVHGKKQDYIFFHYPETQKQNELMIEITDSFNLFQPRVKGLFPSEKLVYFKFKGTTDLYNIHQLYLSVWRIPFIHLDELKPISPHFCTPGQK